MKKKKYNQPKTHIVDIATNNIALSISNDRGSTGGDESSILSNRQEQQWGNIWEQ